MTSLLAKARALEIEGVSTFIYSGSYEIPVRTLTGSVRSDLIVIDKVVGAGEIAVSDHRSSQPTFDEVARLAAECRVGGMLGGKAGVLHLHLGDGKRRLEFLFRLVRETEIPVTQVVPTHINRNPELFEEGLDWVAAGGSVDVTVGPDPAPADPEVSLEDAIARFQRHGPAPDPDDGELRQQRQHAGLRRRRPARPADDRHGEGPLPQVRGHPPARSSCRSKRPSASSRPTRPISTSSARRAGSRPGRDADLIILDADLGLSDVFARGRRMMAGGRLLARGTFSA